MSNKVILYLFKFSSFGGRFKTKIVERSPGPVYNLITNWKKAKDFTVEYNAYKSTSFGPKLSIYHSWESSYSCKLLKADSLKYLKKADNNSILIWININK